MNTIKTYAAALLVGCMALAASAATVITKGAWTSPFSPAANNLALGLMPSSVVNGSANAEGAKTPRVLTDGGFLAAGSTNAYTIGNGAVIEYSRGDSAWGYDVTGLNFYTGWANRDNIYIEELAFEKASNPGTWASVPESAVNHISYGQLSVEYTDSAGLMADNVKSVRITFGNPQESG